MKTLGAISAQGIMAIAFVLLFLTACNVVTWP